MGGKVGISKGVDFGNAGYHKIIYALIHMGQILPKWQRLYLAFKSFQVRMSAATPTIPTFLKVLLSPLTKMSVSSLKTEEEHFLPYRFQFLLHKIIPAVSAVNQYGNNDAAQTVSVHKTTAVPTRTWRVYAHAKLRGKILLVLT
jgi:hypothetical protein